jgi:hypothetical protein
MNEEKIKLVWIAQGYLDGKIKKTYLMSHGIESILYEESLGTLYGFTNTPLGEVEIFVKSIDFEKAQYLLSKLLNHEDDNG